MEGPRSPLKNNDCTAKFDDHNEVLVYKNIITLHKSLNN